MWIMAAKTLLAGAIISFTSWLAGKKPELAGFIMALPISTLIALAFTQAQFNNPENSVRFAQSIFFAVPLSLLFFVPFLLAQKLNWPFWGMYASGVVLLGAGYFAHRFLMQHFGS